MSVKARVKKLIHSKRMLSGITIASFLESTVVPVPIEAVLVPLMQKRRDKLWLIALVTTLGCVAGALVGYAIGYFVFDVFRDFIMQYISTEQQIAEFQQAMAAQGFWFIFSTGITPIPLQIAMLTAGLSQYPIGLYVLAVSSSRMVRYFGLAVLVYYFGNETERLIRKYKWQAIASGLAIVCVMFSVQYWLS